MDAIGYEKCDKLYGANEPSSGEAFRKEEDFMASKVDVGWKKYPKSTKMFFYFVFGRVFDLC